MQWIALAAGTTALVLPLMIKNYERKNKFTAVLDLTYRLIIF